MHRALGGCLGCGPMKLALRALDVQLLNKSGPSPVPIPWLRAVALPRDVFCQTFLPLSLRSSGSWRFLNLF